MPARNTRTRNTKKDVPPPSHPSPPSTHSPSSDIDSDTLTPPPSSPRPAKSPAPSTTQGLALSDAEPDTAPPPPAKKAKLAARKAATSSSWTAAEDGLIWRAKKEEKKSNKDIAAALASELNVKRTAKSVEHRLAALKDVRYRWDEAQVRGLCKAVEEYNAQSVDRYLAVAERALKGPLKNVDTGEKLSKTAVVVKLKAMEAAGECDKIHEK